MLINLNNSSHSYFIGFAQADGYVQKQTRNRGRKECKTYFSNLHLNRVWYRRNKLLALLESNT